MFNGAKLMVLKCSTGIVETGLFFNMAARTYFGNPDGSVKIMNKTA